MKLKFRYILVFAFLFFGTFGCTYIEKRVNDLTDCFSCSIGVGLGAEAHAQIGPISLGTGIYVGYAFGFDRFEGAGIYAESFSGIPFSNLMTPIVFMMYNVWREKCYPDYYYLLCALSSELRIKRKLGSEKLNAHYFPLSIQMKLKNIDAEEEDYLVDYFWLRCSAHLFMGVDIGINILELADFILGFFGIDLLEDDYRTGGILEIVDKSIKESSYFKIYTVKYRYMNNTPVDYSKIHYSVTINDRTGNEVIKQIGTIGSKSKVLKSGTSMEFIEKYYLSLDSDKIDINVKITSYQR